MLDSFSSNATRVKLITFNTIMNKPKQNLQILQKKTTNFKKSIEKITCFMFLPTHFNIKLFGKQIFVQEFYFESSSFGKYTTEFIKRKYQCNIFTI